LRITENTEVQADDIYASSMGKECNASRERNCTKKDLWHCNSLCQSCKKVQITFFLDKRPSAATWHALRRGHTSCFYHPKQGEISTYSKVQRDDNLIFFFILYPLHSQQKIL